MGALWSASASANTLQADCTNFGTRLAAAGAGDTVVLTGLCTGQSHTLPATPNLTIEGAATGTNGFDGTGVATPALAGTTSNGLTLRNLTFRKYTSSSAVSIGTTGVSNPYVFAGDTFSGNFNSSGNGGGLVLEVHSISPCAAGLPSATISGSTFSGNSAVGTNFFAGGTGGGGGGALVDLECMAPSSPALHLSGNTFTDNSVTAPSGQSRAGGGLVVATGGFVTTGPIQDTQTGNTFSGNSVTGTGGNYSGGGEFTVGAEIASTGDRFLGNSLAGATTSILSSEGGGLATRSGGTCTNPQGATSTATNLVATGNSIGAPSGMGPAGEGAAIYAGCAIGTGGYHLTLASSTVTANQVAGSGGVAGVDGEATDFLVLQNTILTGNEGGADIDGFGASPGANATAAHSDVCAIGGGGAFAGAGNICAAPALVNPTGGDVHETAASPTVDSGSNAFVAPPTDVYGAPRIAAGKPGDQPVIDMGAAEIPSDSFTIGKLKGKSLSVGVSSPGTVQVTQQGAGGSAAEASSKKLLNPSSASGGPGTLVVHLQLTKKAKKQLKAKGKLKLKTVVTFSPTGGIPNPAPTKLNLKGKKKKR